MADSGFPVSIVANGFPVTATNLKQTVAILVIGQSNEQGVVNLSDKANYPQAFRSERVDGVHVPFSPDVAVANRGGWWCKVYDDLYDWGYDAHIINGAVGGMGMQLHCSGAVQTRLNNTAYYIKRDTNLNYPDRGDFGDIVQISNKFFVPTGNARKRSAFNTAPYRGLVGTATYQDYVAFGANYQSDPFISGVTGSSAPDVSAITVGQTVTDGDIIFTCVGVSGGAYDPTGTYDPNGNRTLGGMFGELNAGFGFDPLGIISRGWEALAKVHASKKIVYIQNGQTDLGVGNTSYARSLAGVATFFLRRNCTVMIGNTLYSPGSSNSTNAFYTAQVEGVDQAIALMSPHFPNRVFRGANLYASMGTTGPMGGQRFVGSVSGTTLTVTSVSSNQGSGIAVGQNLWDSVNNNTPVGTIVSQLTGTTGGVGTYQISTSTTITSKTLITAGQWLQYDAVHINGAGAVGPNVNGIHSAGHYISEALKTILPQL